MIKEFKDTKNVPISFLCQNGETHYAKYIQSPAEFDCLVYEVFCNKLARHIGIPVPELSLVHIEADSFLPDNISNHFNRLYIQPNIIAFGVKDIGPSDMLTNLHSIHNKRDFNQYLNPADLLLMAMFDMHIGSRDRYPGNFNILVTATRKREFVAIDHYDTFGGSQKLGKINSDLYYSVDYTILRSDLFLQMLKYFDMKNIISIIDNYAYICNPQVIHSLLDETFKDIPASWSFSVELKPQMLAMLCNTDRIAGIQRETLQFIQYNKKTV